MEVVVKVDASEGYVCALGAASAPVGWTLVVVVVSKVVGSTVATGWCGAALSG